jgi:hypothetical protein
MLSAKHLDLRILQLVDCKEILKKTTTTVRLRLKYSDL